MKSFCMGVLLAAAVVCFGAALARAEEGLRKRPRGYLEFAEYLDEFKDREFFEFIYKATFDDPVAENCFMLGHLYHHGVGVPRDAGKARRWYLAAREKGYRFGRFLGDEAERGLAEIAAALGEQEAASGMEDTPADAPAGKGVGEMLRLSLRYFYGLCADLDYEKARDWEIAAAKAGDAGARLAVGEGYLYGMYGYLLDEKKGREWLNALEADAEAFREAVGGARGEGDAKAGEVRPVREYARDIYREGLAAYGDGGPEADFHTAGVRFSEAAAFDVDIPDNYFLLGRIQEEGLCGKRNPYGAGKNYRIATEFGHAGAALRLGVLHEAGNGVRRSLIEAERVLRLAAEAGEPGAESALARVREKLKSGDPENWETSPEFRRMEADAQYRAYFNHTPFRMPEEMRGATAMLLRAADAGQPAACFSAGLLYRDGDASAGVQPDVERAERYFSRAVSLGIVEAEEYLPCASPDP